ncbi:MAG: S8 family serine peptidase [Chloroflexota bacterium]|nr:S8 family serine peptidase [Chloroflexota bacterium]
MKFHRWLGIVVALAVALSVVGGGPPAASASGATKSDVLSSRLAKAASTATFETIVTFRDRAGMDRIDTLDVGAVKLRQLPIAFATLTKTQIEQVAAWPETRSLWHDQQQQPILEQSVPLVGADRVWAGEGLKRPYTGAGVKVAVIDTGVDGLHPDLPAGAKVEGYALAGHPFESEPFVFAPSATGDTYGHGTHVASTIAGTGAASGGERKGVAPGAQIVSFKTDVGAFLLDSYILASFDWILDHPEKGIRVSSNSWGCCDGTDYNPDDPINVGIKALYDAGITVVFAAGNSGGPNTLNTHATSPWVISVAAGTKDSQLASFSSRGRLNGNWDRRIAQKNDSGLYRPSLTAPGQEIAAAKSTQAVVMADGTDPENPMYTYADGTSMATPHVAGAVALMLEARPLLSPQNVMDIIEGTASNMPDYDYWEAGLGYLDAYQAVVAAEKGKVAFPPSIKGKRPPHTLTSSTPFDGTVMPSTWLVRECPDSLGVLSHHSFEVAAGTDVIFAEIEWDSPTQLIYLVLYDPECNEAAVSAALLDIGEVNYRAVAVTKPMAGTWTAAVYGRINIPYPYTGNFQTYERN